MALIQNPAVEATVPGGSQDPEAIPKYVTDLVIPPVLYDDGGAPMEVDVSLRQIEQQVLPPGFPATPLWAYGNPTDPESFHNPSFTIEVTKDTLTTVNWFNDLVVDPEACFQNRPQRGGRDSYRNFPGKGRQDGSCDFLPHVIQDQDGNPVIDQTLLWAAPNQDCRDGSTLTDCRGASADPYRGPVPMVTQVYGAHVGPGSAGYPEAWWLPNASNIDCVDIGPNNPQNDDFACNGTYFQSAEGADTQNALGRGYATFKYTNDQPTTALWYHDRTVGIARLNVYAAGAGFWLIRDANDAETGLISGQLPGPPPQVAPGPGRDPAQQQPIREIPIIIQPRSFNTDGTLFYPADRAFFEGVNDGQTFADNTGVNIPFLPQPSSDIAPVWNPEAFFNTMVVNGRTWPKLQVAPERYRFRLLNAADSSFLNLALVLVNSVGGELPFYQIGGGQGLLPAVVRVETGFATPLPGDGSDVGNGVNPVPNDHYQQALLLGPGQRADVIVDFAGLAGGTAVRLINTAPDAPFGGFPDIPADPNTTGQVMQFVVDTALANPDGDPSTPAPSLVLDANPAGVPKLGVSDAIRDLALLEEESALLCVAVDPVTGVIDLVPESLPPLCSGGGVPFAPKAAVLGADGSAGPAGVTVQLWDDPIVQNPQTGSTETWELWNLAVDAFQIHLDQVKFEVVGRKPVGGSVLQPPEPWEAGWNDTVVSHRGEVLQIKAKFDIPGLYSWGNQILSHGDNEMKVPYCVGEPGVNCPAQ